MVDKNNIDIKLTLDGAEEVQQQLEEVGKEGSNVFKRMARAIADFGRRVSDIVRRIPIIGRAFESIGGDIKKVVTGVSQLGRAFISTAGFSLRATRDITVHLTRLSLQATQIAARITASFTTAFARISRAAAGVVLPRAAQAAAAFGAGSAAVSAAAVGNADQAFREQRFATAFNTSTQSANELLSRARVAGLEVEDIGGSFSGFLDAIIQTRDPSTEQAQIFKSLGINVRDANGNFRDTVDIFEELRRKSANLDATTRTFNFQRLFGETDALELAPLLNQTDAQVAAANRLARAQGNVFTDEQFKTVNRLNQSFKSLRETFNGLIRQISISLSPALTKLFDLVSRVIITNNRSITKFISDSVSGTVNFVRQIIAAFARLDGEVQSPGIIAFRDIVFAVGNAVSLLAGQFTGLGSSIGDAFSSGLVFIRDFAFALTGLTAGQETANELFVGGNRQQQSATRNGAANTNRAPRITEAQARADIGNDLNFRGSRSPQTQVQQTSQTQARGVGFTPSEGAVSAATGLVAGFDTISTKAQEVGAFISSAFTQVVSAIDLVVTQVTTVLQPAFDVFLAFMNDSFVPVVKVAFDALLGDPVAQQAVFDTLRAGLEGLANIPAVAFLISSFETFKGFIEDIIVKLEPLREQIEILFTKFLVPAFKAINAELPKLITFFKSLLDFLQPVKDIINSIFQNTIGVSNNLVSGAILIILAKSAIAAIVPLFIKFAIAIGAQMAAAFNAGVNVGGAVDGVDVDGRSKGNAGKLAALGRGLGGAAKVAGTAAVPIAVGAGVTEALTNEDFEAAGFTQGQKVGLGLLDGVESLFTGLPNLILSQFSDFQIDASGVFADFQIARQEEFEAVNSAIASGGLTPARAVELGLLSEREAQNFSFSSPADRSLSTLDTATSPSSNIQNASQIAKETGAANSNLQPVNFNFEKTSVRAFLENRDDANALFKEFENAALRRLRATA